MQAIFDSIIKLLTDILTWIDTTLININASTIPEHLGIALAKGIRYTVDYINPLLNEIIEVVFK